MSLLPFTQLETHPLGTGNKNDIINSNWELLEAIFVMTPMWRYDVQNLTGGGAGATPDLDGLDTTNWPEGILVITFAGDPDGGTGKRMRKHVFRPIGSDVEDSPNFVVSDIRPTYIFELLE